MTQETPRRTPAFTVNRPCTEHGWLRRPELDSETVDAWERPDGSLYAAMKGTVPRLCTYSGSNKQWRN
jgi:hypothetical protein